MKQGFQTQERVREIRGSSISTFTGTHRWLNSMRETEMRGVLSLSSHVKRKTYSNWSGESLTARCWQINLYSVLGCVKAPSTLVALSAQTTQNSSQERMFSPMGFNSIWKDHLVSWKLLEKQFNVTGSFAICIA